MKINNLGKGIIAFSVLALAGGSILAAGAANATTNNSVNSDLSRNRLARSAEFKKAPLTEAQQAEMKTKRAAVEAALVAGDYNAWLIAVKAHDQNCPLLEKINATNFSRYADAYKLRLQAEAIEKELGIDRPESQGLGLGMGLGMGLGRGGNGNGHGRGMQAN